MEDVAQIKTADKLNKASTHSAHSQIVEPKHLPTTLSFRFFLFQGFHVFPGLIPAALWMAVIPPTLFLHTTSTKRWTETEILLETED